MTDTFNPREPGAANNPPGEFTMTDQFEIKRGAPIPPPKAGPGARVPYPFDKMEVGDCFDAARIGRKGKGNDITQTRISAAANAWAKINSPTAKFTTRIIDDKTVRCWRIA